MTREKVELTEARETLLATLYGHALDARSAHPILGGGWLLRYRF